MSLQFRDHRAIAGSQLTLLLTLVLTLTAATSAACAWADPAAAGPAAPVESHGEPGRIQVSSATAALLAGQFAVEPRGEITVKGKGAMTVYFLGDEAPVPAG